MQQAVSDLILRRGRRQAEEWRAALGLNREALLAALMNLNAQIQDADACLAMNDKALRGELARQDVYTIETVCKQRLIAGIAFYPLSVKTGRQQRIGGPK